MFTVTSYPELVALLRAVLEAKFHKDPDDTDVPGSAILARVAIRLRDAAIAEEVRRDGAAAEDRWREWMKLGPERSEWEGAMAYAVVAYKDAWASWSTDERIAAVEELLSPFEPGKEGVLQFVDEVHSVLGHG